MDGGAAHSEASKAPADDEAGSRYAKPEASDAEKRLTANALAVVVPDKAEDKAAARRRIGHRIGLALSVSILLLAVFVLTRTFMQINFGHLRAAIAATGDDQIAMAFGLTALSFLALTGYDVLALRQLKLRVPYRTTALASFTSYAVSFTLGFPLITAGTVRYWIYSAKGLSPGKIASLTVIAGLTFWLGMILVIGIGFTVRAPGVSHLDHLDPMVNRIIGIAIIGALAAYLIYAAKGRRHATVQGFRLELPGFWLTSGQIGLGLLDLCAAAGALFVLLPPPRAIDYITFVTVYVFGSLLGIASNAPGGIVVFESTMLKMVPSSSEETLFAALALFRIIYYFVPFVLALALLGARESIKRWTTLRAAMSGDADEDDPDGGTVG